MRFSIPAATVLLIAIAGCDSSGLESATSEVARDFALGEVPCTVDTAGTLTCLRDRHCSLGSEDGVTCDAPSSESVRVPGGPYVQVAAQRDFLSALDESGTVQRWEWDESENSTLKSELVPLASPAGQFEAIGAPGYYASCGLRVDGTIFCWDETGAELPPPARVAGGKRRVEDAVPSGTYRDLGRDACGVRTDGTIHCWYYSTLWERRSHAPEGSDFVDVTESGAAACARTSDGSAVCWDLLGSEWEHTPDGPFAAITPLASQKSVYAHDADVFEALGAHGGAFCGIRQADRSVECWDASGALGLPVAGPFVDIDDTCGMTETGSVRCWSFRGWGRSGDCKYHESDPRFEAPNECGTCGSMVGREGGFCACGGAMTCTDYDGPVCDVSATEELADTNDGVDDYTTLTGTLDTFDSDTWTVHVSDVILGRLQPEFRVQLPEGESAALSLSWDFDDGRSFQVGSWRIAGGESAHVKTSVGHLGEWLKDGSGVATVTLSHIGGEPSCAGYELQMRF